MALRFSTGFRNMILGINTQKVTNGTFDTDVTGWTAVNADLTRDTGAPYAGAGNLRVAENGGANPGKAYQDITCIIGHKYQFSGYFKKGTADSGKILIGTTSDEDAYWDSGALSDAAWALKSKEFTVATSATVRITLQTTDTTAAEYSEFDSISLIDDSRCLKDIFNGGCIKIYVGTQPATADTAPSGNHLVTINHDGTTGITFDDATGGAISKAAAETWQGTVIGSGTQVAGWFRLQTASDLETTNTTDARIDGSVATSGGQLNMTSTSFTNGATETINTFTLTIAGG